MTDQNDMLELPKDWKWVKLGEVCDIKSGKNQSKVLNPDGIYPVYGSSGIFGYADDYICDVGTTIIGRKGTINKPLFVTTKFWNVDTAFGLSPNGNYDKKLFYYFCLSFNFQKLDKSTTIPSLARRDLLDIDVPLPPKHIQLAIVSKIEELFSEIENGIESLRTAQQQLKTYRQSVLKWAFEGKLTGEWREKTGVRISAAPLNKNIAAEPETEYVVQRNHTHHTKQKNQGSENEELPDEWKWVKLGNVSQSVLGKMLDKQKNVGSLKPYLRNINVRWQSFDLDNLFEMRFQDEEDDRYGIVNGDLIICEGGEPGRAAIWKGQIQNMKIQKALHRVRFDESVEPQYFLYYLNFIAASKALNQYFTGTTIKHLTGQSLKRISFPLAPAQEQNLIVEAIARRFRGAEKMEENINQSLQQADALKQSILKKAFMGRLL